MAYYEKRNLKHEVLDGIETGSIVSLVYLDILLLDA